MDVELQILKHLARDAHPTVAIVDEYCAEYKNLFKEVRNYECFKYLHVGIMAPLPRKSLPEIAKVVSLNSAERKTCVNLGNRLKRLFMMHHRPPNTRLPRFT